MSIRRYLAAFCIVLFVCLNATRAANPTSAPADETRANVITRVFDVSDLLWQKTNYPAGVQMVYPGADSNRQSAFGGPPVSGQPSVAPAASESAAPMIKLLVDTVAPETWRDNGGKLGSIRELNGQLIITQTPENLQQIANILDALRSAHSRMVVVRAYWLLLPPESVPGISSDGKELPIVDDKLIDAKHLYCGAQTMCFSGQTVHVTSGRNRTMVTNATPVVGSNVVGYSLTTSDASSGVVLQLTPHLEPEGQDSRIGLDLQSNVTEVGGEEPPIEFPAGNPTTQESGPSIDRVNEVKQELHTTVRLPLHKKVLIGGMTLEPASKEDPTSQLYLVIEADAVK